MRICLVRKEDLTPEQLEKLQKRLQYSVGLEGECGPIYAWNNFTRYLYAFLTVDGKTPIAIATASGRPISSPGWWVDPGCRGQNYGNELVDLLARYLKSDGVTEIGDIPIQTPSGQYDAQSQQLVKRLRSHFNQNLESAS